MFHKIKYYYLR